MRRNVNNTDRAVRAALGAVLVIGAVAAGLASVTGIVMLVLAAIMLVTSAVAFRPLYRLLGVSSCPTPHGTRSGRVPAEKAH